MRVVVSILFLFMAFGAFALKPESAPRMEVEMEGEIVELVYNSFDQALMGFKFVYKDRPAILINFDFTQGKQLFPYLKKGEKLTIEVIGDSLRLSSFLETGTVFRAKTPKNVMNLSGLAMLTKIQSSQGEYTLLPKSEERWELKNGKSFEIVENAKVQEVLKRKGKKVDLVLDNGDVLDTYAYGHFKPFYKDGSVTYTRVIFGENDGVFYRSRDRYQIAWGLSISSRYHKQSEHLAVMGRRGIFLKKTEPMDFLRYGTDNADNSTSAVFQTKDGERTFRFHATQAEIVMNFFAKHGQKGIRLFYRNFHENSHVRQPDHDYFFGMEKDGEVVALDKKAISVANEKSAQTELPKENIPIDTEPIKVESSFGRILDFLTNREGVYAGIVFVNQSQDTLTINFESTYGESILSVFEKGDEVNYSYEELSFDDLFQRFRDVRQFGMNSYTNPFEGLTRNSRMGIAAFFGLENDPTRKKGKKKPIRERRILYLTELSAGDAQLQMVNKYIPVGTMGLPIDLKFEQEIERAYPADRGFRHVLKNGDVVPHTDKLGKEGTKISYFQSHPYLYEGQVHKNSDYLESVERSVFLEEKRISKIKPLYDQWMRLMGYEARIDRKDGVIRLRTDQAEAVNEFLNTNSIEELTLYCNKGDFSKDLDPYYFYVALKNKGGDLIYDPQTSSRVDFDADTLFNSKVKEIIQHSDLYIYNYTTFVLDNGFVFSVNNRVYDTLKGNIQVGDVITLNGKPFEPRAGEILKDPDYQLISPETIKYGELEFKVAQQ